MRRSYLFLLGTSLLLLGTALAQTRLWVTSAGAKLKAETRATSATVAEVPVGAELEVLGSEGKWYRVATQTGGEGWIYRGKVSDVPPSGGEQGAGGLFGAVTGSRIEASAADTSRSIRGLSPETAAYADGAGTPQEYRQALDQVLALQIEEQELEGFLEQGRIGEYAQ